MSRILHIWNNQAFLLQLSSCTCMIPDFQLLNWHDSRFQVMNWSCTGAAKQQTLNERIQLYWRYTSHLLILPCFQARNSIAFIIQRLAQLSNRSPARIPISLPRPLLHYFSLSHGDEISFYHLFCCNNLLDQCSISSKYWRSKLGFVEIRIPCNPEFLSEPINSSDFI